MSIEHLNIYKNLISAIHDNHKMQGLHQRKQKSITNLVANEDNKINIPKSKNKRGSTTLNFRGERNLEWAYYSADREINVKRTPLEQRKHKWLTNSGMVIPWQQAPVIRWLSLSLPHFCTRAPGDGGIMNFMASDPDAPPLSLLLQLARNEKGRLP